MKALFIPDNAGSGHRVRCGALAVELEQRGWTTFTINQFQDVPASAFDLVVIDLRSYVPPIRGIRKVLRIVDDPAMQGPCDLQVMAHAGANDMSEATESALIGPEYALLRAEFLQARKRRRSRHGIFDARILAGWSAEELAEHMASAQVMISYGGQRALEACCVWTPTVLMARNRGEQMNAHGMARLGAAVLSREADGEAEKVAANLLGLPELLARMEQSALALVDGHGCRRVADAVEALYR
jgi:spore coat polysaccharide biosynthesis predicted glycosyltransferase SpsG